MLKVTCLPGVSTGHGLVISRAAIAASNWGRISWWAGTGTWARATVIRRRISWSVSVRHRVMISGIGSTFQVAAWSSVYTPGGRTDVIQKGVIAINGATACSCWSGWTKTIRAANRNVYLFWNTYNDEWKIWIVYNVNINYFHKFQNKSMKIISA